MGKIKQYLQKINISQEYLSLRFLAAGIILSISFFLLFITFFKTYTSSMVIFVNAKSEVAAQQKNQIINNISEFPKTLALYDRLLKYNSDVKDIATDKSSKERKEYWNNMVSIKKIGKDSSLIKISITTAQKNDAEQLVKKTTETLFYFTAFYYDIKNDVDLRIIENPITRVNIIGWYWIVPSSLILGFLIATFFQDILLKRKDFLISKYNASKEKFLLNLKKEFARKSVSDNIETLENIYLSNIPTNMRSASPEKRSATTNSEIQEMKKITKTLEKDSKYPNFSEVPKAKQTVAGAPDNLPIADDYFFDKSNLNVEQPKITEESTKKIHSEPNVEQLKKRLNDLLRGEL